MLTKIDGSILEGGGQILRLSVGLSALHQKPIRLTKIRANRRKGGLAAQHLAGIRLVRALCEGQLENDSLGSSDITFIPNSIRSGNFVADSKTAGSVALLLQIALPCILFGPEQTHLTLKGGTNADLAPQIDYTVNVFKPNLQKFGANFDCEIVKRGFFPQGNGTVKVAVDPIEKLLPVNLVDFGQVERIYGEAFVAGVLPIKMAFEMAEAAKDMLTSVTENISIKAIKFNSTEAFGTGAGINLFCKTTTGCYLGASNLSNKNTSTKEVGSKASELLLESINRKSCVDQQMQDQLILFMALADGKSRIKAGPITTHTETAIYISKLLTGVKFNIEKLDNDTNIIECDGIGQRNSDFGVCPNQKI